MIGKNAPITPKINAIQPMIKNNIRSVFSDSLCIKFTLLSYSARDAVLALCPIASLPKASKIDF